MVSKTIGALRLGSSNLPLGVFLKFRVFPKSGEEYYKKPRKRMIMLSRTVLVILLMAVTLLAAGCSQPAVPPTTPAPTVVPTTSSPVPTVITPVPTPTLDYIPGPMPGNFEVTVDVDRNVISIDPKITVTFRGGRGINFVYSVDVVVTRSDGVVEKASLTRPKVNDHVEILGTTGTDRVQVFVTLITKDPPPGPYLIYDEELPFRSRG